MVVRVSGTDVGTRFYNFTVLQVLSRVLRAYLRQIVYVDHAPTRVIWLEHAVRELAHKHVVVLEVP